MKKLLMVLTNSRLDCVKINLELQVKHGDLQKFDKVVFLLNKVSDRHMAFVDRFIAARGQDDPGIEIERLLGNGPARRYWLRAPTRFVRITALAITPNGARFSRSAIGSWFPPETRSPPFIAACSANS